MTASIHIDRPDELTAHYRAGSGSQWLTLSYGTDSVHLHGPPDRVTERLVVIAADAIRHLDEGGLARLAGAAAGLGGQVRAALDARGLGDVTDYITPDLATLDDAEPVPYLPTYPERLDAEARSIADAQVAL